MSHNLNGVLVNAIVVVGLIALGGLAVWFGIATHVPSITSCTTTFVGG